MIFSQVLLMFTLLLGIKITSSVEIHWLSISTEKLSLGLELGMELAGRDVKGRSYFVLCDNLRLDHFQMASLTKRKHDN